MYTKEQLKKQVENMGLTGEETILIHSSMKSIGEVEGGADTVLDAWIEYFGHGLLLLPTHTWKNINADSPVYNPKETPSCVGLLTNMFLKRDGVIGHYILHTAWQELERKRQNIWRVRRITIHRVHQADVMTG